VETYHKIWCLTWKPISYGTLIKTFKIRGLHLKFEKRDHRFHGSKRESRAPRNLGIFSANLCMYTGLPPLRNLCTKNPILMDRTLTLFPKILSNVTSSSKIAPHRFTFPRKKKSAPPLFCGEQTRSSFAGTNWQWHDRQSEKLNASPTQWENCFTHNRHKTPPSKHFGVVASRRN